MKTAPISMIDIALLRLVSNQPVAVLDKWVVPLREACTANEINTVRRVGSFLANAAHECNFVVKNSRENLTYTNPARIKAVFGQGKAGRARFPTLASCLPYIRQPQKLGNYVYANRMGNGPPASGDGFRFRGGAMGQTTGKDNWSRFARKHKMGVDAAIEWACNTVEGSIASFAFFWSDNNLNARADTPGMLDDCETINGGTNGLADRTEKFDMLVTEMLRRGA